MKRLDTIDFSRGLVMIIMALDHTRDLLHVSSLVSSPTDLAVTTPVLFFTRWITHLCAPTFVFLSGVSAFLYFKRHGLHETRTYLLKRGIWLIALELTIVNFALWFDPRFHTLIFEVIGAIGFGFIVLALLLKVRAMWLGFAGLLVIATNGLFFLIPFDDGSFWQALLTPFCSITVFNVAPNHLFIVGYPPIPWIGIMLCGFGLGYWFELDYDMRQISFIATGCLCLSLFVAIRLFNVYGDVPWASQGSKLFTFLSFINVTKYPPSLLFILMMLGLLFFVLAWVEGKRNKWIDAIVVYGRVPLFYFIIHFYVIHLVMLVVMFLQGFTWRDFNFEPLGFGRPKEPSGIDLWLIYLIWILVVVCLFPACRWYGTYKATHKNNPWLKYI